MGKRIKFLLDTNGVKFTTEYLKECYRLAQHYLSGHASSTPLDSGGPRVASRRGLPLIIPGPLRLKFEAMDKMCIRIVLSILSIFRIFKYPGVLKLETITNPFSGIAETLHPAEVGGV